jgi:hypothetical protein
MERKMASGRGLVSDDGADAARAATVTPPHLDAEGAGQRGGAAAARRGARRTAAQACVQGVLSKPGDKLGTTPGAPSTPTRVSMVIES